MYIIIIILILYTRLHQATPGYQRIINNAGEITVTVGLAAV